MTKRRIVPIGPYHPLQEEPEFFKLVVEGEKVVDLEINIGYNHRGHEYISTKKTWDQVPFVVERICGICSHSHPYAYSLAVEDLLGIKPPPRGQYVRTIIAELERIHSHFLWLGLAGHFIGYNTVWMWVWRYREPILDLFEIIVGNRNHYAQSRIGGARRDILPEDLPRIERVLKQLEEKTAMFTNAILDDPVIRGRLEGVGFLSAEDARAYAVVGPIARGSGLEIDVRKDDPYDAYPETTWDMIVFPEGDILAKAKVRLMECFESIKIIRQCLAKLPDGPIATRIDEVPAGEGIGRHEAPRGEVIHYVRSDGSNMPIRHKIRAPSYMNIAANTAAVRGCTIADAVLVLAAMDPCYCCTERTVVYEDGHRKYTGPDLLKLSVQKTEQLQRRYRPAARL